MVIIKNRTARVQISCFHKALNLCRHFLHCCVLCLFSFGTLRVFHNIVAIVFPAVGLYTWGRLPRVVKSKLGFFLFSADCVLYAQNSPEFSYNIHNIHFFSRWTFRTKISEVSHSICKEKMKKNNQSNALINDVRRETYSTCTPYILLILHTNYHWSRLTKLIDVQVTAAFPAVVICPAIRVVTAIIHQHFGLNTK